MYLPASLLSLLLIPISLPSDPSAASSSAEWTQAAQQSLVAHEQFLVSDVMVWEHGGQWVQDTNSQDSGAVYFPEIHDPLMKQSVLETVRLKLNRLKSEIKDGKFASIEQSRSAAIPPISEPLLIVTHASFKWDSVGSSEEGVDTAIRNFRKRTLGRVMYLIHDFSPAANAQYFMKDRRPDFALQSNGGEFTVPLETSDVVLTGGYFQGCLQGTLIHTLMNRKSLAPLRIHYPMKAVFTHNRFSLLDLYQSTASNPVKMTELIRNRLFSILAEPGTPDAELLKRNGLDSAKYKFQIVIDGKTSATFGSGPTKVELHFYSGETFDSIFGDSVETCSSCEHSEPTL